MMCLWARATAGRCMLQEKDAACKAMASCVMLHRSSYPGRWALIQGPVTFSSELPLLSKATICFHMPIAMLPMVTAGVGFMWFTSPVKKFLMLFMKFMLGPQRQKRQFAQIPGA